MTRARAQRRATRRSPDGGRRDRGRLAASAGHRSAARPPDLIKHPAGCAARRNAEAARDGVVTSVIVAAELRCRIESKQSAKLAEQTELVLASLPVLPLESPAETHYGRLRADLHRRGQPIGANDMLIAAHALALGATLVTDNVREFGRVTGLAVENWLRDG